MLMELLEKCFHENPWSDVTNLDELIKLTGLDDITIKVNTKNKLNNRVLITKTKILNIFYHF
jgi:hypothetical protein